MLITLFLFYNFRSGILDSFDVNEGFGVDFVVSCAVLSSEVISSL